MKGRFKEAQPFYTANNGRDDLRIWLGTEQVV